METTFNYVFRNKTDSISLTPEELAVEAGSPGITAEDYPERILGHLCNCYLPGEFVLLPREKGQKRYMRCRNCGAHSHL